MDFDGPPQTFVRQAFPPGGFSAAALCILNQGRPTKTVTLWLKSKKVKIYDSVMGNSAFFSKKPKNPQSLPNTY